MYYTNYHFHYCYNYHRYLVSFSRFNVYFLMPRRRLKTQREGTQNSMIDVICTY